jgi:transcriptional regulator with GAF, ATPase, and Fis domain
MYDHQEILDLLRPLLVPIQEGVIVTDRNGAVLSANAAVYRLFGIADRSAIPRLTDLGGHNLRASLIRAGLAREDDSRHHCEFSLQFDEPVQVNGEACWLRVDTCLVDLPSGKGQLRMIVLSDITAEKRLAAFMSDKEACGVATQDPDMLRLLERLTVVADTGAAVLLQGESGTGKTELARLLHRRGRRAAQPFVEVNCGAIPGSLIESELFGHVKGAFTGAAKDRPGRFRAADGGTLFLDEIGELPRELQPKLLRVLQDGEYEPVGSDRTVRVDVRLVCASNRDLREMVDDGSFRSDLYYRIAVVPLRVPPLRQRPGDIRLLVDVLLKRLALRGYSAGIRLTPEAMRSFMNYPWPGNVRELANAVEHSVICAVDGMVRPESLPDTMREYCGARTRPLPADATAEVDDRVQIRDALRQAGGNKTLAAQILGVDRSTLWRRMQRLGVG